MEHQDPQGTQKEEAENREQEVLKIATPLLPNGWSFRAVGTDPGRYNVHDDLGHIQGTLSTIIPGELFEYNVRLGHVLWGEPRRLPMFSQAVVSLAKDCFMHDRANKIDQGIIKPSIEIISPVIPEPSASSNPNPVTTALTNALSLLPEDWSFKPSNRGKYGYFLHEPDGTIRGEVWEAEPFLNSRIFRHNLAGHGSLFEFNTFADAVMSLAKHCVAVDAPTEPPPPPELSKEEYNRQTLIAAQAVIDGVLQLMNWIEEEIVTSINDMNTGRVVVLEEVLVRLQALDQHVFKLCDEPPQPDITIDVGPNTAAFFGGMFAHMLGDFMHMKRGQSTLPLKPQKLNPELRRQCAAAIQKARKAVKR